MNLSHKKDGILSFSTTWVDLEDSMLSEISQEQKDKYYDIDLIEEENKMVVTRG
jgi:hypothetical protein